MHEEEDSSSIYRLRCEQLCHSNLKTTSFLRHVALFVASKDACQLAFTNVSVYMVRLSPIYPVLFIVFIASYRIEYPLKTPYQAF